MSLKGARDDEKIKNTSKKETDFVQWQKIITTQYHTKHIERSAGLSTRQILKLILHYLMHHTPAIGIVRVPQ